MATRAPAISSKLILGLQVTVAILVVGAYAGLSAGSREVVKEAVFRTPDVPTVVIPRTTPLSVEPLYDVPELVSDAELLGILKQLQPRFPREKLKPNFVEHALRTWSIRAKFDDPAVMSGADMLDFLVNHAAYLKSWGEVKRPLLEDLPAGIKIRVGSDANESVHHDHWLASLTEAGVSLDEPVFSPGRPNGTINDVLQQALRDFRVDEREVEWSAMAFGFWIAPEREWRTTGGRTISFDMLAQRLMRGEGWGVCSGTHRVYSLAVLLRLDDDYHIVSPAVREEIWQHLSMVRDQIAASQFEDGHWPTNWALGKEALEKPADDENYKKVIATGHHLEWLAIAPPELHPPREQIVRAAKWVIQDTLAKTPAEILERYTFYSHVANAMALWRKTHPCDYWMSHEGGATLDVPPGPNVPPPPTP